MSGPVDRHVSWWTCHCGKRGYASRAKAKVTARQMANAYRKIRPYECPSSPGTFHLTSERTDSLIWYRERGMS